MSVHADEVLDASGMACPLPIIKTNTAMKSLPSGGVLKMIATDPGAPSDVDAWAKRTGHEVVESTHEDDKYVFLIRKVG